MCSTSVSTLVSAVTGTKWCSISPGCRVGGELALDARRAVRVGTRQLADRRRRAWPRRTSSGGCAGAGARACRPVAGSPCRASGRPRRGRAMRTCSGRRAGRRPGPRGGPGVATRMCASLARLRLGADRDAAVGGRDAKALRPPRAPRAPRSPGRRARASGTSTSAEGRASAGVVRSTIGSAKASVLPEPVGERARTSSPSSASGRTSAWMLKRMVDRAGCERGHDGRGHAELAERLVRHEVRLLTGSRLAYLETPEGGTRSSSHRPAGLPTVHTR